MVSFNMIENKEDNVPKDVISKSEFQEILLAMMAGGDLYANEIRLKFRRVDMLFDVFRDKPIYKKNE